MSTLILKFLQSWRFRIMNHLNKEKHPHQPDQTGAPLERKPAEPLPGWNYSKKQPLEPPTRVEVLSHMESKGIRIQDLKENGVVSVGLLDILEEVHHGSSFYWSILYLEATGPLGEGRSIAAFEKQIYDSENGLFITWEDLKLLCMKFYQIIDISLIGCKNINLLRRYENDQEIHETCDIVIEMIDSTYWEIFSKDEQLINRLASKFKKIELLEYNFEK